MKVLFDANPSDAAHLGDERLLTADDHTILAHAAEAGQVIVSADTDLGELLLGGRTASSLCGFCFVRLTT